jgi:hypothetical protein
VYPLIFLALGVALRDKVTSSLDLRSITCEELTVRSHDDVKRASLDGNPANAGRLVLYDFEGKPVVLAGSERQSRTGSLVLLGANSSPQLILRSEAGAGAMETLTEDGVPQIVLKSTPGGGIMRTIDKDNQVVVTLGHEIEPFGVYGVDEKNKRSFAIRFVGDMNIAPQPGGPQPQPPGPQPQPQPGATPPNNPASPQPPPAAEKPSAPEPAAPKAAEGDKQ